MVQAELRKDVTTESFCEGANLISKQPALLERHLEKEIFKLRMTQTSHVDGLQSTCVVLEPRGPAHLINGILGCLKDVSKLIYNAAQLLLITRHIKTNTLMSK